MLAQSSSGSWYRSARLVASIAGGRYGIAGLIAATPSLRVGRDRLGAWQGFGVRRVHLQVVDDTAVDQLGEPDDSDRKPPAHDHGFALFGRERLGSDGVAGGFGRIDPPGRGRP